MHALCRKYSLLSDREVNDCNQSDTLDRVQNLTSQRSHTVQFLLYTTASVWDPTYMLEKFNITCPILLALYQNVVSAYWLTVGWCLSTALDL